jgi:hypothetical protein
LFHIPIQPAPLEHNEKGERIILSSRTATVPHLTCIDYRSPTVCFGLRSHTRVGRPKVEDLRQETHIIKMWLSLTAAPTTTNMNTCIT